MTYVRNSNVCIVGTHIYSLNNQFFINKFNSKVVHLKNEIKKCKFIDNSKVERYTYLYKQ